MLVFPEFLTLNLFLLRLFDMYDDDDDDFDVDDPNLYCIECGARLEEGSSQFCQDCKEYRANNGW